MAVIKNLCGTEPPVACTCQPEDGDDSDEDDIGNLRFICCYWPKILGANFQKYLSKKEHDTIEQKNLGNNDFSKVKILVLLV